MNITNKISEFISNNDMFEIENTIKHSNYFDHLEKQILKIIIGLADSRFTTKNELIITLDVLQDALTKDSLYHETHKKRYETLAKRLKNL